MWISSVTIFSGYWYYFSHVQPTLTCYMKVFPNSCANKPYFQSDSQRSAFFGKLQAAIMILHFWTDSYGQTDSEDPDLSGSVQITFVKFLNFLTTQNITFFSCVNFFLIAS